MKAIEDRYLHVDGFFWAIAPPDVTERPIGFCEVSLFTDALKFALSVRPSHRLEGVVSGAALLSAMREKWPEAVEAALPKIKKRIEKESRLTTRTLVHKSRTVSVKRELEKHKSEKCNLIREKVYA